MQVLNRCLVIIRPRQPFLDWLQGLPEPITDTSLLDLRQDCHTYLLPEAHDDADEDPILEDFFEGIFAAELAAWWRDVVDWPSPVTLSMFKEWFDVEWHSMVLDAVGEKIEVEEYA